MRTFWRVTFLAANGKRRHVWATAYKATEKLVTFRVVNAEGDEPEPAEMVFATPRDVVRLRPAQFDNTYATLKVLA
jgi:hypothetical protein